MLRYLFKKNQECFHEKISPDVFAGYCPDCGEYVENQWFLARCGCCGIKHKTIIIKGKIRPEHRFCTNCGDNHYIIEKLDKINFIDINYAVIVKEIILNTKKSFIQTWVDKEITPMILIAQKCL